MTFKSIQFSIVLTFVPTLKKDYHQAYYVIYFILFHHFETCYLFIIFWIYQFEQFAFYFQVIMVVGAELFDAALNVNLLWVWVLLYKLVFCSH
jgi:hypothetical protein